MQVIYTFTVGTEIKEEVREWFGISEARAICEYLREEHEVEDITVTLRDEGNEEAGLDL